MIQRAKPRGLDKKVIDCYFERHHIVPRCLGGLDNKDNLVLLTGREHYICHWLLWKSNKTNNSLLLAYHKMIYQKCEYQDRNFKITSAQYEVLKTANSNRMKFNNPFSGKRHTEEVMNRIKETWKKKVESGFVRKCKGIQLTQEHKRRCSEAQHKRYSVIPKVVHIAKGSHDFNGTNNPRCIKISINGKTYNYIKEACKDLNMYYAQIVNRLKDEKFENWFYIKENNNAS